MKRLSLTLCLLLLWAHCAPAVSLAHRTTGNAPLPVHCTTVDRNSAVRATSNITGVTFGHARNLTAAGTGVAAYTAVGQTISYAAPGDSAGTPLALSADLKAVKLYSGNGVDWIYIDVTFASLPVGNASDNITITSLRSTGVTQPTSVLDAGDPDYLSVTDRWNFGDPDAITYTLTDNHNSNTERRYNTAHLYTEPGTYQITLGHWSSEGTFTNYTETVTVSRQEDTATVYYVDATSGSNGNAGTNPAAPLQTFAAAWAKLSGNNIILKFKRGETWAISADVTVSNSDITITSYYNADGTDDTTKERPHFTSAATSGTLISCASGVDDVKFCHLYFTGPGSGAGNLFGTGSTSTPTTNILIYDCYATAYNCCQTQALTNVKFGHLYHFLVANEFTNYGFTSGGNGMFTELSSGGIMGNRVATSGGEHNIRVWGHDSGVIAHNYCSGPASTKQTITVRGVPFGATNTAGAIWHKANQYTCLVDNTSVCATGGLVYSVAPTNEATDERIEHVVVDGDQITATSAAANQVFVRGRDICFCNGIFTTDNGNFFRDDIQAGIEPRHQWIRLLNNVIVSSDTSGNGAAIVFEGENSATSRDPENFQVINNIVKKTGASSAFYAWSVSRTDIAELTGDYNLYDGSSVYSAYTPDGGGTTERTLANTQSQLSQDANSISGSALFNGASDYTLQAGSAAVGAGGDSYVPFVRLDRLGALRTTDLDMGAYERGASVPSTAKLFRVLGTRLMMQDQ